MLTVALLTNEIYFTVRSLGVVVVRQEYQTFPSPSCLTRVVLYGFQLRVGILGYASVSRRRY